MLDSQQYGQHQLSIWEKLNDRQAQRIASSVMDPSDILLGKPSFVVPMTEDESIEYELAAKELVFRLIEPATRISSKEDEPTSCPEPPGEHDCNITQIQYIRPSLVHSDAGNRTVIVYRSFSYSRYDPRDFIVIAFDKSSDVIQIRRLKVPAGYLFAGQAKFKDGCLQAVLESPNGDRLERNYDILNDTIEQRGPTDF